MLDPRSYPVDPYLLRYKLEMAVLGLLVENEKMADDFEYFSSIARGRSCTPKSHTPERDFDSLESQSADRQILSESSKERVSRKHSHGRELPKASQNYDDEYRPRTNSVPSKSHLLRVRNFQTSGKKLQNRGDTVKSASHHSLVSSSTSSEGQSDGEETMGGCGNDYTLTNTHRILLLGAEGVGKTALTQQFLTSDDIAGADYLDDGQEKYCTVQVDHEESFLIFMDSDYDKNNYDPSSANAYIVVYSCTDRDTFEEAKGLLKNLRHFEKTKAIILCGNKSDLVRKRQVSTEDGRQLAAEYGAKFTETSTMLNHKVDNLLVGILSQIKEQGRQSVKSSKKTNKSGFKKSVKGLVNKIVHRGSGKKSRAATP
ncbi:GTP-binding protein RAD-like [Watersipora subatra]|uniref:GTP-binding protein RAD-like n=1 Tax=Watersipora subatra TaxID=2589382 RepID=UPI00355BAB0C